MASNVSSMSVFHVEPEPAPVISVSYETVRRVAERQVIGRRARAREAVRVAAYLVRDAAEWGREGTVPPAMAVLRQAQAEWTAEVMA